MANLPGRPSKLHNENSKSNSFFCAIFHLAISEFSGIIIIVKRESKGDRDSPQRID
jgi:hypothetical protein